MKYEELDKKGIEEHEKQLIEKADRFWIEIYGKQEASDVDKLRLLSRQGKILSPFQNALKRSYFRKQGMWTDGKTTLKEREKQLILKKTEFGNKIAKVKNATIADIDEIIKKAKEKKKELEEIPVQMKEEYKIDKLEILETLRKDLQEFYDYSKNAINKEVDKVFNEFLTNIKSRQDQLIEDAKTKIQDLQKIQKVRLTNEVEKYSAELEAELTVLEYKENDEELIKQYNEEVRKINQELNEIKEIPIESSPLEDVGIFVCEECGKICKSKAGLASHEKVHEEKDSEIETITIEETIEEGME